MSRLTNFSRCTIKRLSLEWEESDINKLKQRDAFTRQVFGKRNPCAYVYIYIPMHE